MGEFHLIHDKQYPNAVTLVTPDGERIRYSHYKDGSRKVRFLKSGPRLIRECSPARPGEDFVITVVEEGWTSSRKAETVEEISAAGSTTSQ